MYHNLQKATYDALITHTTYTGIIPGPLTLSPHIMMTVVVAKSLSEQMHWKYLVSISEMTSNTSQCIIIYQRLSMIL